MADFTQILLAGFFSLAGVTIGAWLTHGSTKTMLVAQQSDAKKVRQLGKLEYANSILHSVDLSICNTLDALFKTVSSGVPQYVSGDISEKIIELEYLVRVNLISGKIYFFEIKSLANKIIEMYNGANQTPKELIFEKYQLSSIKLLNEQFRDSVEHLREEIVSNSNRIEAN